jgi:hypothetical protein
LQSLGVGRTFQEVTPELRKEDPPAHCTDVVARPADPLQPGGDRIGAFDLNHEVDRPHVDPQFEGTRRDDGPQTTHLECILDLGALVVAHRSVMCTGDLLIGEFVESRAESFGQAAGVGEDDGAALLPHQFEHARLDVGPDTGAPRFSRRIGVVRLRAVDRGGFADRS